MYPLNVKLAAGIGFALVNDIDEHRAATAAGYVPALVEPATTVEQDSHGRTVESVRAELDAAGIEYDKRHGLIKLISLLPA